ncbi:BMP family ABC transporter substrate-binding protein [Microbacterium sp. 18062]|uniref:BMP family ABC transporter substrate-binding protein n=1 Tax=Microbacterium sp. 18062 TaxID=2681410 RepID=UPI00135C3FAD|nr:BMP family ABC transporter substrate-binding protein [Microbacterium sp. 18062]
MHDQQAGDGGVIDSQIEGVEQIAEDEEWSSQAVYVADSANYESSLRNVADSGPTVIVTSFYRITDAFNSVAEEYPDIKFIHLYADPVEPAIPNLLTVSYDSYKLMYASGVLAGTFTETGKVGIVLGDTQPLLAAEYNAFAAGATSVDPSIEVTYGVVGNFDDATKAQEVAEQLYSSGVDVIQADAGGADAGTIAASQATPGRFIIGYGLGPLTSAPDQTLAVSGLEFSASVLETVPMVLEDGFAGGHLSTGIGDVLSLTFPDSAPVDDVADRWEAAKSATEAVITEINDGTVDVPFVTSIN